MVELTPIAVEREMLRLVDLLTEATNKILTRSREAAVADADYKVANAKAILLARAGERKMTVDEVEATAVIATQNEYRNKVVTAGVLDSAREAARNIRAQMDALRSVNSNLRVLVTADS